MRGYVKHYKGNNERFKKIREKIWKPKDPFVLNQVSKEKPTMVDNRVVMVRVEFD